MLGVSSNRKECEKTPSIRDRTCEIEDRYPGRVCTFMVILKQGIHAFQFFFLLVGKIIWSHLLFMNNMKYAILVCLMLPLIALTQVTEKNESTPYWKTLPEPVPTILDYSLKVMFNEPSEVH